MTIGTGIVKWHQISTQKKKEKDDYFSTHILISNASNTLQLVLTMLYVEHFTTIIQEMFK